MSKKTKTRILIKQAGCYYYLMNLDLSMSDGSLYISLPRKGVNSKFNGLEIENGTIKIVQTYEYDRPKTKEISYHSSGLIRYKNLNHKGIFAEPISEISTPFTFLHISVPKINLLDQYKNKPDINEECLEAPTEADGRSNFSVTISPNEYFSKKQADVCVKYDNLFDIIISVNNIQFHLPSDLTQHFIYLMPSEGPLNKQKYDKQYSQLLFHQKLQGAQDVIIYRPNAMGIYKMYFSVPMRKTPKIKIKFKDLDLEAIILEDENNPRTNTSARFKVKNKHGYIKKSQEIVSVELDAEL